MPADRLLGTLLRSLQTWTDQQDTPRLLGTSSSLLTTLNNPLNVTLLTSHLLAAPAIWARPEGLRTSLGCLSVFHSASQALMRHEDAIANSSTEQEVGNLHSERGVARNDWIKSIITGADRHSPRWRHLLALGGLLLGFGPIDDRNLSRGMRAMLEKALVLAVNLSLEEFSNDDDLGPETLTLVLNHCFPILSDHEKARLDYDRLLNVITWTTLHSHEGLRSSYFLGAIDLDVQAIESQRFQWPEASQSFQQVQVILSSPLISSLGPLARMIGHAIEQVKDTSQIISTLEDFESLAKTLNAQWLQTKLSEIDPSEEAMYLNDEALNQTTPALWKLLRSTLFATVIVLRSTLGRLVGDRDLAGDLVAPKIATQALHTLRNLYFITSRTGASSFSQYTFVNLTATDILANYPSQAEVFLRSIQPTELGHVPKHPVERGLDLFFLNTAEHFTLVIPPRTAEDLLVAAAIPYLAAGGNNHLLPIFEAAHSVMLATFAPPANADLAARHLPFYVDALFHVFPQNLSARQFRLAFTSLLQLASPPRALAIQQPLLAATLLELLRDRASHAGTHPLPDHSTLATGAADREPDPDPSADLSEQAVLIFTVLDTLPQIPLGLLDEWLPLAAEMVHSVRDPIMRQRCQEHFWHVLVEGGMDPDRSGACQAWWSTAGGRELVLYGLQHSAGDAAEDERLMTRANGSRL